MRTFKTTGIVIKRKNVGEADRILTIYTKDQGKLQVKAKGVRKITSKRASHIEPLNIAVMTLYKGEGMHVLTEVESINSHSSIKNNLSRVAMAYHICELIDSLCPENQEQPEIYDLLVQMLSDLENKERIGEAIHTFEISLLTVLGFTTSTHDLTGSKASIFIESILEKKLKSRQIIPQLLQVQKPIS
ncbi:MAG TPA: DNA repair protein RecO [Patescibacteria group bacterium]